MCTQENCEQIYDPATHTAKPQPSQDAFQTGSGEHSQTKYEEGRTTAFPLMPPQEEYISPPIGTTYMGLLNRGADCFVNSALNSLYFVPQFYNYFLSVETAPPNSLIANLKSFVSQYGKNRINPRLISQMRSHSHKYHDYDMGSSYEFILSLLESIDTETKERLSPSSFWGTECYGDNEIKNELIRNQFGVCQAMHSIFSVLVEENKICSRCQEVEKNYVYNRSLFLDIITGEFPLSLESSLQAFLAERTGINDFCKACNEYRIHTFQSAIKHSGSALIIHLQRFHSSQPHAKVSVPDTLLIPGVGKFSLCSAVRHIGNTPDYGHYTCCAKASNGWMLFDDSRVCMEEERLRQEYLKRSTLFIYVKIAS